MSFEKIERIRALQSKRRQFARTVIKAMNLADYACPATHFMSFRTPANRRSPVTNKEASLVISAFGGVASLCRALRAVKRPRERTVIYKWTYPYTKLGGTGGIIPFSARADVLLAAKHAKIRLPVSLKNACSPIHQNDQP